MKTLLLDFSKVKTLLVFLLLPIVMKASLESSLSQDSRTSDIDDDSIELFADRNPENSESLTTQYESNHTDEKPSVSNHNDEKPSERNHTDEKPEVVLEQVPSSAVGYHLKKFFQCLCFWRVYEYKKVYYHPGYEADLCLGTAYCFTDSVDLARSCCQSVSYVPNLPASRVRWNSRYYGHPVCTRTGLLSLSILVYAILNVTINTAKKVDSLFGPDFEICKNDLLASVVTEVPDYSDGNLGSLGDAENSTQALESVLGFYTYVIDNIAVDFSPISNVPSRTALNNLEEELFNYSTQVNITHHRGYVYYPDFWPNEASETSVRNYYEQNNISVSSNTTTTIQSRSFSDVIKSTLKRIEVLCFFVKVTKKFPLTIEYGISRDDGNCKPFELDVGTTITNTTTIIENITNIENIQNDVYNTVITSDFSLIQLAEFGLSSAFGVNVTVEEFSEIAQSIYEERKEQVKQEIVKFINRVNWASSIYPFVAVVRPLLTPGYEVSKLGLRLRLLTTVDVLSRIPFIIVVVALIYLVEFLPAFTWKDIFFALRNPYVILEFILGLGTNVCYLQSKDELAFIHGLGEIASQQERVVEQMQKLVSFVNKDRATEETYLNITGLVFRDLYQNLTTQNSLYEQELSGEILRDGFSVMSGKVLCDFNRTTAFNITSNIDCATLADTAYIADALNQVRDDYLLSFTGINWVIMLYPFMPAAVTVLIESIFRMFCPMAGYRGRFISTQGMEKIENQNKVIRFRRYTAIIPFALSVPFVIIGLVNGIIF